MRTKSVFCSVASVVAACLLSACGGGLGSGGGIDTLGGTVTGLSPSNHLTLQNGIQTTQVSANGSYSMPPVSYGSNYLVRVLAPQPSGQNCTVSNGQGTVTGNVTNVNVTCTRLAGNFAYVLTNPGTGGAGTVQAYTMASGALTPLTSNATVVTAVNPSALAVDPTGHYVFVASAPASAVGSITAYSITPAAGNLTSATSAATGVVPSAIAVDPSGKFVYVTNASDATVTAYSIASGTLVPVGTAQTTGSNPSAVSVDPSGKFVVVASSGSNTLSTYSITQPSGALQPNVNNPFVLNSNSGSPNPSAVAVGPVGNVLYTANPGDTSVSVMGLDSGTGNLLGVEVDGAELGARSLAVDPNGGFLLLLNADSGTVTFYAMNALSGRLTTGMDAFLGFVDPFAAVSVDPTGGYAYVTSPTDNRVLVYAINASSGVLTLQTTLTIATPTGLVTTIGPH